MARGRSNMVVFMVLVAAALLQSSKAQTTHVVGDALGWVIPPGGPIAYSTWASRQTFRVGDSLVFNFTTGNHNVAEVTRGAFNSCNTNSPISISTTGPATILLNSSGEHYYICTVTGHCGVGQKLAINVSAASSSPAPQPATPPPAATPSPAASPPISTPPPTPSPVATPVPVPSPATSPSPSGSTPTPPGSAPTPSGSATPSSPSPTESLSPPPPPPPPPPGNSAPSVAVATLPLTILSIAIAFLY